MFVHGNNISQKENHKSKYRDDESRRYLAEIKLHYEQWKSANQSLISPGSKAHPNDLVIIAERTSKNSQ